MKYTAKKLTVLLTSLLATACVLSSCKENSDETNGIADISTLKSEISTASVSVISDDAPPPEATADVARSSAISDTAMFDSAAPFSSYTFSVSDSENNYMITVSPTEDESSFKIITEDNAFNYSEFTIKAPENYAIDIPYTQDMASNVCRVLKNTADDTVLPDIIQFTFYLDNFDTDEELPYTVKRLYSVKNSEFTEIAVYDISGERLDYISEYTLLRTEGRVFMPTPDVTFDEDGACSLQLEVYDFDEKELTLKKRIQSTDFSENDDNMLYYGYAAKAVADNIAKYFTTSSLNIGDYYNTVEVPSLNSEGASSYYFYVDDPRFSTKAELESFVKLYFDAKTTDELFVNAPQKYCDINGKLCTLVGDAGLSYIGNTTITSYIYNSKDNTITYKTKAERYDETGRFYEFIDSGDFTLSIDPNSLNYKITQYKTTY